MVGAIPERYLADAEPRIATLAAKKAFEGLNDEEQKYAYHMARASWAGASIISTQWTPHAVVLYKFLTLLLSDSSGKRLCDLTELKTKSDLNDDDFNALLAYSGLALVNLSNYRSFGNTKFLPRLEADKFDRVVKASDNHQRILDLWSTSLRQEIYTSEPEGLLQVGEPSKGHLSNYFPIDQDAEPPTEKEVQAIQAVCDFNKISTTNTRLLKKSPTEFDVLIASIDQKVEDAKLPTNSEFKVRFVYGDFSEQLSNVVAHLKRAQPYAGTEKRKKIIEKYIESFQSGSIGKHEEASELWVSDVGPAVETYIGFIEAYVDPYMARAEWEGFVACVDKEGSKQFDELVDQASVLIKKFPWPAEFEVPEFQRPDYTSIEILSFATGEPPAGINLPNYSSVREKGYKNVSLANILSLPPRKEDIKFLSDADRDLMVDWSKKSFAVQVAIHELLGHGSGRLLREDADGNFNFDKKTLKNPLTGGLIETWYKEGETPGGKIGAVYGSFEEMKAETCALYLCGDPAILKIFGHTSQDDMETIQYMVYLSFAHAGLRALELYDPKSQKHGQAHMQARFGIARWLIDHGIVNWSVKEENGEVIDIRVSVDKQAVLDGRGKRCVGNLLLNLQVLKSIADAKGATDFYKRITAVDEKLAGGVRDFVLKQKTPRRIVLQPNMFLDGDKIELREYEATLPGLIQSCIEREIE